MSNPANAPTVSKSACSVEGCDNPSRTRGWCDMHYRRWWRSGDPEKSNRYRSEKRPRNLTPAQIFDWEAIRARRDGDCLYSTLRKNRRTGYVQIEVDGRKMRLHQLSLEVKLGRRLHPGEYALHTCHNRSCFNPDHLYPGTQKQNIRDMMEAGRHAGLSGENQPNAKLTNAQVVEIRRRYAAGWITQKRLAEEYGVSETTISAIITRTWWAGVK